MRPTKRHFRCVQSAIVACTKPTTFKAGVRLVLSLCISISTSTVPSIIVVIRLRYPCPLHESTYGYWRYCSTHSYPRSYMEVTRLSRFSIGKAHRYPLNRRSGGSQNLSGLFWGKISCPCRYSKAGSSNPQPSSYSDYAISSLYFSSIVTVAIIGLL